MKLKFSTHLFLFCSFVVLFSSCGSINNSPFAKRKYTNGIFVNKAEKLAPTEKKTSDSESTLASKDKIENMASLSNIKEENEAVTIIPNNTTLTETTKSGKKDQTLNLAKDRNHQKINKGLEKAKTFLIPTIKFNKGKSAKSPYKQNAVEDDNTMLLIKVILAILIPPLAVFVHEKITTDFWIDLILWLLFGVGRFTPFFFGFWGIAIIYALLVIFDVINLG